MSEDDYAAKYEEFGDEFSASMGAEGIRELLRSIDINAEAELLRNELKDSKSEAKIKKYAKRLKVLEAFQRFRYQTGMDDHGSAAGSAS